MFVLRWKTCFIFNENLVSGGVSSDVLLGIKNHPPNLNGSHLSAWTAWIINEFEKFFSSLTVLFNKSCIRCFMFMSYYRRLHLSVDTSKKKTCSPCNRVPEMTCFATIHLKFELSPQSLSCLHVFDQRVPLIFFFSISVIFLAEKLHTGF